MRRRHGLRRWCFDHSENLRALGIGAVVVAATLAALAAAKLLLTH